MPDIAAETMARTKILYSTGTPATTQSANISTVGYATPFKTNWVANTHGHRLDLLDNLKWSKPEHRLAIEKVMKKIGDDYADYQRQKAQKASQDGTAVARKQHKYAEVTGPLVEGLLYSVSPVMKEGKPTDSIAIQLYGNSYDAIVYGALKERNLATGI